MSSLCYDLIVSKSITAIRRKGRKGISENGAPEWVYELFKNNPKLNVIALSTDGHTVVYAR